MGITEALITPIATIIGLLVESFSTYFTQLRINVKKIKRDVEKEKEIEIENIKRLTV